MKKSCLIIACAFLGLWLVAVLGIAVYFRSLSQDIPPFNAPDLIRPVEALPFDQNAFTHYLAASEAFQPPEDADRYFRVIFGEEEWDADFIRSYLDRNEECLGHVRRGNRLERCLVPRIESYHTPVPYLTNWRLIVRLFDQKAKYHTERGQPDEALGAVLDALRFARLCEADAGGLIHFLVAIAMRAIALDSARSLIRSGILEDRHLLRLVEALRENEPSTEGFVLALKTEYEVFANSADEWAAGRIPDDHWSYGLPDGVEHVFNLFGTTRFFHPNRTKRDMAMFTQEMIDQAGNTYAQTELAYLSQREAAYQQAVDNANWLALLRIPNFVGELLLSSCWVSYPRIAKERIKDACSHRATMLLAALHLFRHQHGHFPQTLDELVPGILPEVPADPFDGAPMRYSHEKGVVYSVGVNLVDSGGSKARRPSDWQPGKWGGEDIVFDLEEGEGP